MNRGHSDIQKACPIVIRMGSGGVEILAFLHPIAGKQIVKGTIEVGETPVQAALRELMEESGITEVSKTQYLGQSDTVVQGQTWHFVLCETPPLPDTWSFHTEDDGGHEFRFFWHPIRKPLGTDWHETFGRVIGEIQTLLKSQNIPAKIG